MPRPMKSVDSVVMKAATRSCVMTAALTAPKASPMTATSGKATIGRHAGEEHAEDDGAQIHVGADRQVDAGDQQDEGHADGDDRDVARLVEDVDEIDRREETVRHQAEDDDQHRKQEERRVLEKR